MPIRTAPPTIPPLEASDKLTRKVDAQVTRDVFVTILIALALAHFLLAILVLRDGIIGYFASWRNLAIYLIENPLVIPLIPAALILLYRGIDLWRHPNPKRVVLPPFPPLPDLRFTNSLYIGSAWTRGGKQPGEELNLAEDELIDPEHVHVIIPEKGLFGNLHCLGGVGGGKTSTLINPILMQAIEKWPRPPHPGDLTLGPDGRYHDNSAPIKRATLRQFVGRLGLGKDKEETAGSASSEWNPYVGMTYDEALQEYERLLQDHLDKKWGLFVIDPKGDLTEVVQRLAARAGRLEDVIVLRPDGEHTYNPLTINTNDLVQAEIVLDGIEAVSGQAIQQYWRSTMSEWLANALTILRAVDPTRITFKSILRMARSENLRSAMVAEAEAIMREAQEEEERLRRVGKTYSGVKVNPAAIEFFRDWDDVDTDPSRKQAVVSGIKSQSKFFVDDEMAPFLSPEMPATFAGFEAMIDRGLIVCLRVPLDQYGPLARVLGILVLADAQQAARARINKKGMNQERVVLFCVDEISAYLNRLTKEFIAMNRQSRVCFLAAHQSLGQLEQHGDRSFRQSFNDNLRTKISYNAPNAEAARHVTAIFGSRRVFRESHTHSMVFNRVERDADPTTIKPVGPESAGMTTRYDEIERPWFEPEEFMSLRTGECIIREFDGTTTLPPRKIKAPPYFEYPSWIEASKLELDLTPKRPHPIVCVGTYKRDQEYVGAALAQTGFVIIEALANRQSELAGFKFVTDVGTVVASCEQLEELQDTLSERLTDPRIAIVLTDLAVCATYFSANLGIRFDRVLGFSEAYRRVFRDAPERTMTDIFETEVGRPLSYSALGAWEFHRDLETNRKNILEDSCALIAIYSRLGEELHRLGEDVLESIFEETRQQIDEILLGEINEPEDYMSFATTSSPAASDSIDDISDWPSSTAILDTDPFPEEFFEDNDDPFSALEFPETLDTSPALEAATDTDSTRIDASREPEALRSSIPSSPEQPSRTPRRTKPSPGDTTLDPSLFEVSLNDANGEAHSTADAAGAASDISLPDDRLPLIPFEPSHDSDIPTQPSSGSSSDAGSTRSSSKGRRSQSRTTGRARRARSSTETLEFGFSEDPQSDPHARESGVGSNDARTDISSGAPID